MLLGIILKRIVRRPRAGDVSRAEDEVVGLRGLAEEELFDEFEALGGVSAWLTW